MLTSGQSIILFGVNDAEASAWRARVNAAGGSVSSATYKAVTRFVRGCKQAGIWDKLNRVNLFCGENLTAALVPLKVGAGSATDTNVNFVSGDYTEATGITGNAISKYLGTGLIPSTSLTLNNSHLALYNRSGPLAGAPIGAYTSATQQMGLFAPLASDSKLYSSQYNNTTAQINSAAALTGNTGFCVSSRTSSASHAAYRNGVSIVSQAISAGTLPNLQIQVGAFSTFVYGSGAMAGYSVGTGLTDSEVSTYNTIMEAFQDALGRGVQ